MTQNEPPDDAILVRGGTMKREDMAISAEAHYEKHGVYALTVWCAPRRTAGEIACKVGTEWLPWGKIRSAPVQRVRALGYGVVFRGKPMHVDLILPSPPSATDWDALDGAFDPPEVN